MMLIEDLKKFGNVAIEVKKEVQNLSDILSGSDANEGFIDPLQSALQIIHDFESELSSCYSKCNWKSYC